MPRPFYRIHGHIDAFGKGVGRVHLPVQEGLAYGIHEATSGVSENVIASLPFLQRMVPGLPVWQLRHRLLSRDRDIDAIKVDVLARLGALSTPTYLIYSEDPVADEVPGRWENIAAEMWRVPPDADLRKLVSWLYLGAWILYSAEEPVSTAEIRSIDLAPSAETILEMATRLGLQFVVVSFHDDVLWTIALGHRGL